MVVTMCYSFKDRRETSMTFGPSFSTLRSTDLWFIVQYIDVLSDFALLLSPLSTNKLRELPFTYLVTYLYFNIICSPFGAQLDYLN